MEIMGLLCSCIFPLVIVGAVLAGFWKVFEKMGKPGWAGLVPFYNVYVILEVMDRPIWWIALFFVPCLNIVVTIIMWLDLAKSFGKDVPFAIGLILLGPVFVPILGFGPAQFVGPRPVDLPIAQQHLVRRSAQPPSTPQA